ncbi:MAG TPA: MauE/DoxX family redox-associated membrane protein [Ktedonobacteraceae bacterium]|jgi:uncharacterized membrane protein YphA (DoxX/SURF4 family)|nr:MauE/DoxX family redox-associated membrane protein [Ktedonobacteraceae bacterium]
MQYLIVIAQTALGLVFLTSAGAKVRLSRTLLQAIQQYGLGLIGPKLAYVVARLLLVFELLLGLLLVSGFWPEFAAIGASGILLIFTITMVINLIQGHRFHCHCFGAASAEIGIGSLSRNILLIIISLLLATHSPWIPSAIQPLHIGAGSLFYLNILALILVSSNIYMLLLIIGEIDILFRIPKTE